MDGITMPIASISCICPPQSPTWIWYSAGPAVAVRHRPSPVAMALTFSTVRMPFASGTFDGSCATSAAA